MPNPKQIQIIQNISIRCSETDERDVRMDLSNNLLAWIFTSFFFFNSVYPSCDLAHFSQLACELWKNVTSCSITQSTSGVQTVNLNVLLNCTGTYNKVKELSLNHVPIEPNTVSKLEWIFPNLESLEILHSNVTLPPQFPWTAKSDSDYVNSTRNITMETSHRQEITNHGVLLTTQKRYKLKLAYNAIHDLGEFVFRGFLHTLDVSSNRLIRIGGNTFSGLKGLENLVMKDNSLEDLSSHPFDSLHTLKYLDLSFNNINSISQDIFSTLINLEYLDLSNNKIEHLPDELFPISMTLTHFVADWNPLVNIPISIIYIRSLQKASFQNTEIDLHDIFDMLMKINWLPLYISVMKSSANGIENAFSGNPEYLRKIDLSGTKVRNLDLEKYNEVREIRYRTKVEKNLLLLVKYFELIIEGTNFICDCTINTFKKIINQAKLKKNLSGREYIFHKWKCSNPPELRGQNVADVNDIDIYCEKKLPHCPYNCTCFEWYVSKIIIVDCRNKGFYSLPRFMPNGILDIWFQHNNVSVIEDVDYLNRTRSLYLSHNYLEEINGGTLKKMTNLRKLYLDSNNFLTMPQEIQKMKFEVIKINNNPFKCDCHSLWMKYWILQRSLTNSDIIDIKCNVDDENEKGRRFLNTPDFEFVCLEEYNSMKDGVIPSVSSSFAVLMCVLGLCILYLFRFEAKILMYVYLGLHPFDLDVDTNREPVDVLVVYFPGLTNWVIDNIVSYLENYKRQYVVCDMMRDFIPGFSIQENLASIVKHSKRMILVVSPDMTEGQMLKLIWNEAQVKIKELRYNYVITVLHNIKLKNITNKEMLKYARHGNIIASTDRLLCHKLLYCMPVLKDTINDKGNLPGIQACVMNMYGDITLTEDLYERHVFISYSDTEIQYILKHIKPVLEGSGYTLCLPDRDFIPGASKEENILKAIDNCLHTLFFVTENHLLDEWSIFTFRTAFEKSLRHKRNHLIVILSENVQIDVLDEEIKNIVKTHVILQIGEEWFVQKLLNSVSDAKPCAQCFLEETIIKRELSVETDVASITESMLFDAEIESDTDNDVSSVEEKIVNNIGANAEETIENVGGDTIEMNDNRSEQIGIFFDNNHEDFSSDDSGSCSTNINENAENFEDSDKSDEENGDVTQTSSVDVDREFRGAMRNENKRVDQLREVENVSICSSEICICEETLELNIKGSPCFNVRKEETSASDIMNNSADKMRSASFSSHSVSQISIISSSLNVDNANIMRNPQFYRMKTNYDVNNSEIISDSDNNTDSEIDESTL